MSVERIRDAIMAEAEAEAGKIKAEAARKHDQDLAAARRRVDEEFERKFELGRQAAERESHQKLMQTRARHGMKLLERRNAILDDVFRQAGRHVAELPDEEYRAMVAEWLKQVPVDLGGDILCAQRDGARLASLIDTANAGRPAQARLSLVPGERPVLGGVVFRAERFELDLSLDTRLERLRKELAPEVAEMIFPPPPSL